MYKLAIVYSYWTFDTFYDASHKYLYNIIFANAKQKIVNKWGTNITI